MFHRLLVWYYNSRWEDNDLKRRAQLLISLFRRGIGQRQGACIGSNWIEVLEADAILHADASQQLFARAHIFKWFVRMWQRHIHPFRIRDQQRQCQSNQVEAMQLWWYHTVGQLHLRRRSEAPIRTARSACTSAHRLIMPKVSPIYYQAAVTKKWHWNN